MEAPIRGAHPIVRLHLFQAYHIVEDSAATASRERRATSGLTTVSASPRPSPRRAPPPDILERRSSVGTPSPSPLKRTIGPFGYTARTNESPLYGVGASGDPWLSADRASATITFEDFTGGVVGLGGNFFTTAREGSFDWGTVTLTARDADGSVSRTIVNPSTSGFLGFMSTSGLESVSLTVAPSVGKYLWPTADNLILAGQISSAVPEPATWAMMIIGFGAVGSMVRPSRRRNAYAAA